MLEWSAPQLSDGAWVKKSVEMSDCIGSDVSFANIYLLRGKYNTEISRYRDFLIRRYYGTGARLGYTFPVGRGDAARALKEIELDAETRNEKLRFAFLTEAQKELLEELMPGRFIFSSDAGDSDYIYSCRELAGLSGKSFHKKKNHVSKFMRTYPDYTYAEMGECNWEDAAAVADAWYYEHMQQENESQIAEYRAIREALQYFRELELMGGIIYVNDSPCAMTLASKINEHTVDVHFEKAVGECAANGGYAAINNFFAAGLEGITWLNREEDIGIEGLRKAKMSYHPKILLKKYSAVEK